MIVKVLSFLMLTLACSAVYAAPLDFHGYLDARGGIRLQGDTSQKDESMAELRLQLEREFSGDYFTFTLRSDFLYDDVPSDDDLDIERGTGWLDLREASLLFTFDIMDVKAGRQILTWGTGDLLFINDMFPKDWRSFFVGRDEEYLKAPSDSVFVSLFPAFANIDIAYTPRFDSDRYISGDRISYWNPMLSEIAGRDSVIVPSEQDEWFDNHETALRISGNIAGYETAVYGYYGYWKNPEGMNPASGRAYFPELSVYGASMRGGAGKGIMSLEFGYYDSREDNAGVDPFVPNDEVRALAGYEQELVKDLSCGLQYYIEQMMDHDEYLLALQDSATAADENRQLLTLRLTKQAMNQNMIVSMFVYYSPTDNDMYARPVVKYKASDNLMITAGGNLFAGKELYTFFGQFEDNSNLYSGIRYSF